MPIPVSCSCGKKFAAPDQLAGKRVKCPACAEPIQIPAAAANPSSGQGEKPKSLKVACSCGKTLMVKAELAGKAVKCPSCGNSLRIGRPKAVAAKPSGGGIDELLDEVDLGLSSTGHRCPECRHDLQPDDIICVKCGYNLETGKKLHTRTSRKVDPIERLKGVSAKDAKKRQKGGQSFDLAQNLWLIVALIMIVPTAILWFVNPQLAISTLVMISLLTTLGASIWILVIAFQDSVLQGVLSLLVPFYMLFFVVTHWEESKSPACILAVGFIASIVVNVIAASVVLAG